MNIDERLELLAKTVQEQAAFSRESDARIREWDARIRESDAQSRERDARLERRIEGLMLSHELLAGDLKSLTTRLESLSVLVTDIGVGTARLLRAIEAH